MPRRKDISNDPREAIVAAHQSGKGYKAKHFEVHQCTERNIIKKWKLSRQLPVFPGVDVQESSPKDQTLHAQRNGKKTKELHLRLYRPQLAC